MTGYPYELAGEPAPPPEQPGPRVLAMALKAHGKHLAATDDPALFGAAPYRLAGSLEVLRAEADTAVPARNRRSDGWIGDRRHQELPGPHGPGSGSDHNPWVQAGGWGIVRALDLTNDPALALPAAFERIRAAAAAGLLPQLLDGGYLILNGRITDPDFSGYRVYRGADPHVSHGHASVSLVPGRFDDRLPWAAFSPERQPVLTPPAPPAPVPTPAPGPGWTGPDLTGAGPALRGDEGNNGPRVAAWQAWLRDTYPLYAKHLEPDGWWGAKTTAVNREFGQRSGVGSADGRNIGPKLATAYARAGLFGARASARDRVVGHVRRDARR